ncbi:MAG TPA: S-methyl-5'-thioadenosine phosphorylase, partial [Candidatus Handelsmanbacteria bacterium]|nr:S-methyl-5'-thioadenosine phosphorylase [Candidatus Handelsmanbacteria bacterium]
MSESVVLSVIGGSGLYQMEGAETVAEHALDTPYGKPSDVIVEADVGGRSVYFLPRHGKGHKLLPCEVPARANIHALKQLGVTHVLAVSACGIMREEIKPGDMVVPDQIFDRTRGQRPSTFFGEGVVGHLPFADPFCEELREIIIGAGQETGAKLHAGGTYICMEGPLFSTRAESNFYRKAVDASVIGMTALPEAKLAREAELCYAMLAMGTDYDCWHEEEEDVTIDQILAVMKANGALANRIVAEVAA